MRGQRQEHRGSSKNPHLVGGLLAVAAALAFGLTTPFLQSFGHEVGPFLTAGVLYGGATASSLISSRAANQEAALGRRHLPRLAAIALLGAVIAPASLAWGLQRTQGTIASLMLNTEAFFTVLLARLLFREHVGPRVAVALLLMVAAGALLVSQTGPSSGGPGLGTLAIAVAALAWAADNALTRSLADFNPNQVILVKASLGAMCSLLIGVATREPFPHPLQAVGIAACGAVGYGVSLRLYLGAQRRMGAGRTGSIFALAPFVGAVAAWAMGERGLTPSVWISGTLFAIGVLLHLTERHAHRHRHEAVEHEHAHRHDDDHHDHHHEVAVEGSHSHVHQHDERDHEHPHAPDLHHRHRHG